MNTRPVIILELDRSKKSENGKYPKKEIGRGVFHGWGCNFEELNHYTKMRVF